MTIDRVIEWLRSVEHLACKVYSTAADTGKTSPALALLLERLAEDESRHSHLMGSAAELMRKRPQMPVSSVLVDDQTRSRVEGPLQKLLGDLQKGHVVEQDILDAIIQSETSEWNDIFLYVVNTCQDSRTFQYIAATIQAHLKRIESYFATLPANQDPQPGLRRLPEIWQNSILVVDDDQAVLHMWERFLGRHARIARAENGRAALRAIEHEFFNVIVTDSDMPILDGVAFIRKAIEKDANLRGHFIICTADTTHEVKEVARDYDVPILKKPVTIGQMLETVQRVLEDSL